MNQRTFDTTFLATLSVAALALLGTCIALGGSGPRLLFFGLAAAIFPTMVGALKDLTLHLLDD